MKFLTCIGARSGKNLTTIVPNFVVIVAFAVAYFASSSLVGGVGLATLGAANASVAPSVSRLAASSRVVRIMGVSPFVIERVRFQRNYTTRVRGRATARAQAFLEGTSSNSVTSGGARKRSGGPQVPVPRLT